MTTHDELRTSYLTCPNGSTEGVHRGLRTRPILAGLRSRPSVHVPRTRRFLPRARRGGCPLTLPERRRCFHLQRGAAFPPCPVKDPGLFEHRSAFFRRVLTRCPDRSDHLEREPATLARGFATSPRLPTCSSPTRHQLPDVAWARPRALGSLITIRASWPRAARRRLPSADPQAHTVGPRHPMPSCWAARLTPRHTSSRRSACFAARGARAVSSLHPSRCLARPSPLRTQGRGHEACAPCSRSSLPRWLAEGA